MLTQSRVQRTRVKVVALSICSLIGAITSSRSEVPQPTPVRVADAACAKCHARIVKSYLATPMANASGAAAENLKPGSYLHAPASVEYTVNKTGDRATLDYRSVNDPAATGHLSLTWFLGSGHLGTTYLYSTGDYLFESPVAWYASSQSYAMKPGLEDLNNIPPPLPMQSSCLRCHMSSVNASDAGTINHFTGLPFLHGGITCEACHGPSEKHVDSAGKSAIINPAKLHAEARDSVCISCHLEGDVSVERAGHSALDYRPGEPISTYLAFYVRSGERLTNRAVSEVEQLSQSVCKQSSGDRMSCTSCHDPHLRPTAAARTTFYRARCLACHTSPEFTATHHPENQDCTSCHMPRLGAVNVLHVAWTDHRILRRPEPLAPSPAEERGELKPIFSPTANRRDLAMANYQALLEGDRTLEPIAFAQLQAQRDSLFNDRQALDALGTLSSERGDFQAGEQLFRRALEIDPSDLTALSNLGTLLGRQGRLEESRQVLDKAFAHNQDIPGLAVNLARVQCMAGDGQAAHATLNTALIYCPNVEEIRRLFGQLNNCGKARMN